MWDLWQIIEVSKLLVSHMKMKTPALYVLASMSTSYNARYMVCAHKIHSSYDHYHHLRVNTI